MRLVKLGILLIFVVNYWGYSQNYSEFDDSTLVSIAKTWFAAYYSGAQAQAFISDVSERIKAQSANEMLNEYQYLLVDPSNIEADIVESEYYKPWRSEFVVVVLLSPEPLHWGAYLVAMSREGVLYRLSSFSVLDIDKLIEDNVVPIKDSLSALSLSLLHAMVMSNVYFNKVLVTESNYDLYVDKSNLIRLPVVSLYFRSPINISMPQLGYRVQFYTVEDQVDRYELVLNVYEIDESGIQDFKSVIVDDWSKNNE